MTPKVNNEEAVSRLIHKAYLVQQHVVQLALQSSLKRGDRRLEEVHRFLECLVELWQLLDLFESYPGKDVEFLAKKVDLTRNGLYFRFEMIGLKREQLCANKDLNYTPTMIDLIRRSTVLGPLAKSIHKARLQKAVLNVRVS